MLKKTVSIILVLCMAFTLQIGFVNVNAVTYADINRDGVVDIADIVLLRVNIIGYLQFSAEQISIADVNKDKAVDIIDVAIIRKAIVNKTPFDEWNTGVSDTDVSDTEIPDTEVPSTDLPATDTETPAVQGTPFEKHGALSVKGTDLVDKNGEKYQLYGMSTHGIAWFPKYVSLDTFETLRNDWNTNCVRIAMYTYEYNGYCNGGNKENLKRTVKRGVDYATQLGMYVIIDWHILNDKNPLVYMDDAVAFFEEMSELYKDYDNVIYEICNEPNTDATWDDVKTYANKVIPVIRNNDSNAVILVGTPSWCQDVDKALKSPLDYDNIMYDLHFYAATHTSWLRSRAESAIKGGLPVFISEFGLCDASGNGALDYEQADEWKKLIDKYNLSYMCWNLANNKESSSVILSSCSKRSDWTEDELSDQGKYVVNWFKGEPNP